MIIANRYSELVNSIEKYSDAEYLELQVIQLKDMFYSEASAIKNTDLELMAFSNHFAPIFNLNQDSLGKTITLNKSLNNSTITKMNEQEQSALRTKKLHFFLFNTGENNKPDSLYAMRIFPLINPSSENMVGTLVLVTKLDPVEIYRFIDNNFVSRFVSRNKIKTQVQQPQFSEEQSLIVSCILMGFHQRKEIAAILNKTTTLSINDLRVRYNLNNLYEQYNCNSTHELIQLITANKDLDDIPESNPDQAIGD